MKTHRYNWHTVTFYDSIQDAPITRFQAYNLNLMLDAGIGSDMNAVVKHRAKAMEFARAGDMHSAEMELINMEIAIQFIMSNTSPEMQSFAALVYEIDGERITDDMITEDGIKEIIKRLGKVEYSWRTLKAAIDHVKKKFDFEFEMFFPKLSNDAKVKEMYSNLKKWTLATLEYVITGNKKFTEQAAIIDTELLMAMKPKIYYGSDGLEVKMINNFENTCTMLETNKLSVNPKSLTTLEYYRKVEIFKEIIKERTKKSK